MSKIKKCTGCEGIRGSKENHPCPLEEALNGKEENHCNCCSSCIKKCKKEIGASIESINEAYRQAYMSED